MKKRYPLFTPNWRRIGLVTAISVFPYFGLQAQTAPAKLWDKTLGGSGFDNLTNLKQTADGGFILGGHSDSGISGDKSQASKGAADFWVVKTDASGNKTWDKTFGGSNAENFRFIQQTTDGGYILAGYTDSGISGDKSQASKGGTDFWVVKIDASGNKTWDKTFGGSAEEKLFSVQQTTDGGYILGGSSKSGLNGDKSQAAVGDFDFWIVKLDGSGNKTWDKTFGGSAADELYSLRQTADGGYILGGTSKSGISGDKTQASKGLTDYWIIKTDGSGVKTWDKTYGGSGEDIIVFSIQQTTDGGYVFAGTSASGITGDKTEASKGLNDFWIIKTDASGVKTWDKTLGGSSDETMRTMQQTADGGYIMGGFSTSGISGDKTQASMGLVDYWVVKLNASGTKSWDKALGATGSENLHSLHQTSDGGYILGGMSDSGLNGDKTQASKGGPADFWVTRLAAPAPTVPLDMGVTAISAPNSGCGLSSQETITITVNNMGTAAQSNIPVSYTINGTGLVNETVTGPVAPNSSVSYSFTTKANLSTVGTYAIEARTNLTGDALATNDGFTKAVTNYAVPAVPTITSSGTTTLCSGGTLTLTATSATTGVTYQWLNNGTPISGATSATYTANAAGSYTAKAIVGGTCSSAASAATTLTVNPTPPAPGVNAGGALAICTGDSVALTAVSSVTGATFNWFKNGNIITGANAATYMAKSAGNYTATAIVNGCNSPASIARAVTVKTVPAKPTITQAGTNLTSSSPTGNQWYLNGTAITGATFQTFFTSGNGSYTVVVIGSNGCPSAPSSPVVITNTGINDHETNLAVAVYPNPSSGLFTINLPQGSGFEMTVTDLTGKVIKKQKASEGATQLNLEGTAKGIYLLKISGERGSAVRKLIVE